MPITILAVGKKHEDWVKDGIERYQKRLKKPFMVEWVLLAHSSLESDRARQEESDRIFSRLPGFDVVILLDERGYLFDSPSLADKLRADLDHSKNIVLVIGGAYGVNDAIRQKADLVWSLSPLVLPHQLVRLVMIEQLYRAQEISGGGRYHHE